MNREFLAAALAFSALLAGCSLGAAPEPSTWSDRTQHALDDLLVDADPYPIVRTTGSETSPYQAAQLIRSARALDIPEHALSGLIEHMLAVWQPGVQREDLPIPPTTTDAAVLAALVAVGDPVPNRPEVGRAIAAARDQLAGDDIADPSGARVVALLIERGPAELRESARRVARSAAARDRCGEASDLWSLAGAVETARLTGGECHPRKSAVVSALSEFRTWADDLPPTIAQGDDGILAAASELVLAGILDKSLAVDAAEASFELVRSDAVAADPVTIAQLQVAADALGVDARFGPQTRSLIGTAVRWDGRLADTTERDAWQLAALADVFEFTPGGPAAADLAEHVQWSSTRLTAEERLILAAALDPTNIRSRDLKALAEHNDAALAPVLQVVADNPRLCTREVAHYAERVAVRWAASLSARAAATLAARRCQTDLPKAVRMQLDEALARGEASDDVLVLADAVEARCGLDGTVRASRERRGTVTANAVDDDFGAHGTGSELVTVEATRAVALLLAIEREGCAGLRTV